MPCSNWHTIRTDAAYRLLRPSRSAASPQFATHRVLGCPRNHRETYRKLADACRSLPHRDPDGSLHWCAGVGHPTLHGRTGHLLRFCVAVVTGAADSLCSLSKDCMCDHTTQFRLLAPFFAPCVCCPPWALWSRWPGWSRDAQTTLPVPLEACTQAAKIVAHIVCACCRPSGKAQATVGR